MSAKKLGPLSLGAGTVADNGGLQFRFPLWHASPIAPLNPLRQVVQNLGFSSDGWAVELSEVLAIALLDLRSHGES